MFLSADEIGNTVKNLEQDAKNLKDEIFRISWYMRGGVDSKDLFYLYSYEDRMILNHIIKENIEATKKSGMNFL